MPRPSREEAEAAVRTLLALAGDDPHREGLLDTPRRVVKAYEELFGGYRECPDEVLDALREVESYNDIVLVGHPVRLPLRAPHGAVLRQGAYRLLCRSSGVVGLSKLARVVDVFARRLQTQET